jgi:branched-chain amino acid transport system ATP-binding protein
MPEILTVRDVVAGYGNGPAIINGASITLRAGEIQCMIGPNGAGKSTMLKVISGVLPLRRGQILLRGESIGGLAPHEILRKGICYVPQERALFPRMTVRENLRMGGYVLRDRAELERRIDDVLDRFPILRDRARQFAGTLSGGQQQMLSMARTLIVRPAVVILDEPSLGLAPMVVRQMFEIIGILRAEGITVLLVEQNALMGLKYSDWGVVLDLGRTLFEGPAREILADPRVQELYLGRTSNAP